jgi:hypothetical protein
MDAGVLSCLDGFMNIALEQTEEHVNGVITNRYGDSFIRGNNGASRWWFISSALLIGGLCMASFVYLCGGGAIDNGCFDDRVYDILL